MKQVALALLFIVAKPQPTLAQTSSFTSKTLTTMVPTGVDADAFCAVLIGDQLGRWIKLPEKEQASKNAPAFFRLFALFVGSVSANRNDVEQTRLLTGARQASAGLSAAAWSAAMDACVENANRRLNLSMNSTIFRESTAK